MQANPCVHPLLCLDSINAQYWVILAYQTSTSKHSSLVDGLAI